MADLYIPPQFYLPKPAIIRRASAEEIGRIKLGAPPMTPMFTPLGGGGLIEVPGGDGVGYRIATNESDDTVIMPTGIAEKDLLLWSAWFLNFANAATVPSDVTPTGWTKLCTDSYSDVDAGIGQRVSLFARLAPSGYAGTNVDPGTTPCNASDHIVKAFRWTGAGTPSGIVAVTPTGQLTTDDPTAQSQNAGGQTPPLVVAGHAIVLSSDNPPPWFDNFTFSPAQDGFLTTSSDDQRLGWKAYTTNPQNITIDWNNPTGAAGVQVMQSGIVCITLS